ncbi:MAG TPA: hypothetical protein VH394_29015 [Thermoanaerobaculia bacterium]|nr:hypothetical protein [Thermoanaerobaculia bacterium]
MADQPAGHTLDLAVRPDAALAALRRAAEDWGAELEKGQLHLPVVQGLKRGVISGPLRVEPTDEGARVVFDPEESHLYVQMASVFILLVAIVGALATVLWPFFPQLLPVSPFGALLALGGWFLVLSRLRTSGPDEFLVMVEAQAEAGAPAAEA